MPIGLAALAHGTSKIGDWLTTAFESVFSLPDDVQLRKTGTLFGHRVMLERLGTQFASPVLMRNLDEFYRECVVPDLATGQINPDALAKTENIWQEFSNTNPGLLVTIADYNDPSVTNTVNCPSAYGALTTQLNLDANSVLGLKAQGLFPEMSMAAAKTALSNALTNTQQFFAPSASATPVLDQIRQGALCNYIIDAPARVAAQIGDAAQVQQATATAAGIRSFKSATTSMYSVAMSGMPKFRNAVEMIAYAVFPLIVIIVVVAGQHAGTFLKGYVGSLLWVQLWPPLYAVMNYMMNLKTKSAVGSMVAANGNGYLSCNLTNWLGSTAVDDMNVAAYLTLAIPVIAWGLVQGTLHAASSATGTWMQGSGASGGRFLDNTVRSDQITAGQYNMAPTVRTGGPVQVAVGADGVSTIRFADGLTAVDASGMQHRMNLRLNAGSRMSAALQQQSEQAETAAIGNLVTAAATTAAALQQSADFVRTHARGERAGMHYGLGDQTGFSQAVNQTQKVVDSFAKKHGLDQTQAAQILGMAEAAMQNPKALDLVSPLSVRAAAQVSGRSEASAKQLLEEARNYAKETGFSEAVDKVRRATREATFDTSDEASRRAMEGIRASLDQSRQHTDQAAASHQQSLAFKEAATRARENSAAWETGMLRQFVDWMGTQRNEQDLLGRNFNAGAVAQMAEKNPELLTPFVERFFKERIEPTLSAGIGEVKTAGDVQAFFEHGKAAVPGANDIATQGKQWLGRVQGAAAHAGVDPRAGVSSQLPQQIVATQGQAEQAIGAGRGHVQTEGKPLEDKVRNQTAPGTQPLLGLAATNAAAQILPDGASRHMMERLPGIDMSVGTPGSAVAEAAAERARMGQPRDPVMQSVTNVAGAIDGALDRTIAYGKDKIGEVIGTQQPMTLAPTATSIGEVKTAGDGGDLLGGAWALGESKIGEMIGTRPGTAPARPAPDGGGSSPSDGNGSPPPSNR